MGKLTRKLECRARERWLLGAAVALGITIRIAYVVVTRHYPLAGDAPEYDLEGLLISHGHWFWTAAPYGVLHPGAWKAPGYPAWVGFWYALVGHHPLVVRFAQVPLGAITILLAWMLARRLFGWRVALLAAFVVAVYPFAWQYEELLYSESLATPLTLACLIVILTRPPSRRRAVMLGVLLGVTLLVRPSSAFLLLGALAAWCVTTGWKRGLGLTVLAAVTAILVVAPWTIRNAIVLHGFVPISLQDAALYGTFNSQSAHDPVYPYAWRKEPPDVVHLFQRSHPLSDVVLRSRLIAAGLSYISSHPSSVPAAFFWNGLSRLWDIRRPSHALVEVPFEGRSKLVTELGLYAYYVLLVLALVGMYRARRQRALVLGVIGVALGASIVFAVEAGTRYRAPLEPLVAVMACAGALGTARPQIRSGAG